MSPELELALEWAAAAAVAWEEVSSGGEYEVRIRVGGTDGPSASAGSGGWLVVVDGRGLRTEPK